MQRCAQQLHTCRGQELRRALSGEAGFDLLAEVRQQGRDQRRQIEGCEDSQRVPDGEERVARYRNSSLSSGGGACRVRGREHFGELGILVEAEGHIDSADSGELCGAG